jgi:glycosyltransferase involved in cell wall biosynthesis
MSEPRVAVIVRARNEERNIERFIRGYPTFPILVADGGSTDATLAICASHPNVTVRPFHDLVERNGVSRNPEGEHINFLIDWATADGYDWVIYDDCDCVPNYLLRDMAPTLFQSEQADAVFAVRIYLYLGQGHLARMCQPGKAGVYEASLWAWRTNQGFRARLGDPFMVDLPLTGRRWKVHELMPPVCLLHDSWPTEAEVERKRKFYQAIWPHATVQKPLDFGGPLLPLPEWAHE